MMLVETREAPMTGDDIERTLVLERKSLVPPDVPPIPVFHFAFTRVGNQVLLEPGYVDLVELRQVLEHPAIPGPSKVQLFIKEKYLMDRETLVRLRDAAEEILQGMPNSNGGEEP